MIPIYIINLERQPENYERCLRELVKVNNLKNVYRFNAVDAKTLNYETYKDYISKFYYNIYSKKLVAISLSHILLCKYLYENRNEEYFLICEDDIKIEFNDNLQERLYKIINKYPKDFDVINLNWMGICKEKTKSYYCGSCASYIISRKGLKNIKNLKIKYHIDLQRNNYVKTYTGPYLINTYEKNTNIDFIDNSKKKLLHKPLKYWFNSTSTFTIFNKDIPDIILYTIILIILIIIIKIFKKKYNI